LALSVQFPSWDIVSSSAAPRSLAWQRTDGNTKSRRVAGQNRTMALITDTVGCAEQLARFFPKLSGVRIPIRVTPQRGGTSAARLEEAAVVEYGSEEYVIFCSTLPLEFADRVRISRDGGGRPAEATVIALQYHEGRKAVAVRFVDGPCEWMRQS
jgi:hypothetical protein